MECHDRPAGWKIGGNEWTLARRVIMSEKLKYRAVGVSAGIEYYIVVIAIEHICAWHIAQPRMEDVISEIMLLCYFPHVIKILPVADNKEFHAMHFHIASSACPGFLYKVRHQSFHDDDKRDDRRIQETVMSEVLLEEDDHRLVEGIDISDGVLLGALTLVVKYIRREIIILVPRL